MIVKVRIAPVERWCERALRNLETMPELAKCVGIEVAIRTDSMHIDEEGERCWFYADETVANLTGYWWGRRTCEHVLEMD